MKLKNYLFEMSNLWKDDTGIDYIIWVSSKKNSKHAPRIKLSSINSASNLDIVIIISDDPKLKHGKLQNKVFKQVKKWILLNKKTLLDYWNENISTKQMINKIKKV